MPAATVFTAPTSADGADLEAQLARLERMRLNELRTFWASRWGYAPRLRSVVLLRHMIAWRLQTAAYEGLDAQTKFFLRQTGVPLRGVPPAGSILTREYLGVLHRVEVGQGTFLYGGQRYRSLTAVAKAITGTHWNGPRFFGLRDEETNA